MTSGTLTCNLKCLVEVVHGASWIVILSGRVVCLLLAISRRYRLAVITISYHKLENRQIFPTDPCLRPPFGGNPLESGDEIWHQKTRVLGLPDGEEIMQLTFFVLTQYRRMTDRQTDRQTDTLRSLLPALA